MAVLLIASVASLLLLIGMALGALVRGYVLLPSDRRRLRELAGQPAAEARIDAMTRATAQAMRDAVRGRTGR